MTKWYALAPSNHTRWYPYIRDNELMMHCEDADTDMGDCTMDELIAILGPVIVGPVKES